ncbi:hypothetical protein MMC28_010971 [Mycoblastus sanguinarius]|nr:hypothetical protein [Mycoblastus sanguinarius]
MEAYLRRLTTVPVSQLPENERRCLICTRHYEQQDEDGIEYALRFKECQHILGSSCAMKWFERHPSCPVCRRVLFEDNSRSRSANRLLEGYVIEDYSEDSDGDDDDSMNDDDDEYALSPFTEESRE